MNEAAIKLKMTELIDVMTSSPLLGQVIKGSGTKTSLSGVALEQTSLEGFLDQVRLQVKYLVFDLEATRRENRYLRQMLESRNKRDRDDMKDDGAESP